MEDPRYISQDSAEIILCNKWLQTLMTYNNKHLFLAQGPRDYL